MSAIRKKDWAYLPKEIQQRYERSLSDNQINILWSKIPFDTLRDTDPDMVIQNFDWVETFTPEQLKLMHRDIFERGEGFVDFDGAIPFDRNLWGATDQMFAASKALVTELRNGSDLTPAKRNRLQFHANILISNVYRAYCWFPTLLIWYSRDKNKVRHIERYRSIRSN